MSITIYIIIFMLFLIYLVWTWNSTSGFKKIYTRTLYVICGTVFMVIFTLILFNFSKIGINYPSEEVIEYVQKIILLVFVPINGFLILPRISNIINLKFEKGESDEQINKKIMYLGIIILVIIIFECIYFKSMQFDIINLYKLRK